MRQLIAGNWKMNGLTAQAAAIAGPLREAAHALGCDLLVCPPATLVTTVAHILVGSPVAVGGQDCHARASGAHTGDISAAMLRDAGARFVILGHSERRADHGETDAAIRAKAATAIEAGLVPIVCVGETEAQRDAGQTLAVIGAQIDGSVPAGATAATLVVAYEPVWAIGTGLTPTNEDIAEMHKSIREGLVQRFGEAGERVQILYGGSMKPTNAKEILAIADVDGGLVGGASLLAKDFYGIICAV